ncbi:MAG: I78 family peptidase inhibitor [Comamonas sp.]
MRTVLWMGIPLVAALAGCAGMGPGGTGHSSPATPPQPLQRCDAAAAQWAVGKTNTVQHVEEARRRSGALMARVLRPNQPTTLEFNAERLNLLVDATGRFTAATCG